MGMTRAIPTRGRRAHYAGRKSFERVKAVAVPTPALWQAAVQQCEAFDMRSAQAGPQVRLCDKLRNAARHAARVGSIACYVPLLKHRRVGVAVWRHAICQCTGEPKRGACCTALEVVQAHGKGRWFVTVGTARFWAACALSAPPLLRW